MSAAKFIVSALAVGGSLAASALAGQLDGTANLHLSHVHGIAVCSIPFQGGDREETYFKLWELGCDGFSTDYPSVMFEVIRKLKAGAAGPARP